MLAIVPARGASVRYPGKNVRNFLGQPLIYHTLDAMLDVKVVVASDSQIILEVAAKHKSSPLCVQLPEKTTTNKSTVLESVLWMIDELDITDGHEIVGMFLPTAPLRRQQDVQNSLAMMTNAVDGVISTTDYEFPPTLGLVKDDNGFLRCFDKSFPFLTGNTRSQDHSSVIRPNGAVYLKWVSKLKEDRNFFAGNIASYHMSRNRSPDIDTEFDFKVAEFLAKPHQH